MKTNLLANTEIKSNTGNRFYMALEKMTTGRTAVINGIVVTKWNENAFEVGTWGKAQVTIHNAVDAIAA